MPETKSGDSERDKDSAEIVRIYRLRTSRNQRVGVDSKDDTLATISFHLAEGKLIASYLYARHRDTVNTVKLEDFDVMGVVNLSIIKKPYAFYVVNDDFPLSEDGIFGRDFTKVEETVISYYLFNSHASLKLNCRNYAYERRECMCKDDCVEYVLLNDCIWRNISTVLTSQKSLMY